MEKNGKEQRRHPAPLPPPATERANIHGKGDLRRRNPKNETKHRFETRDYSATRLAALETLRRHERTRVVGIFVRRILRGKTDRGLHYRPQRSLFST